jgi:SagB-type dehydrogenase family enzyme
VIRTHQLLILTAIAVIVLSIVGVFLVAMKFMPLVPQHPQIPSTVEEHTPTYTLTGAPEHLDLPLPKFKVGNLTVEEAIAFRRSLREYLDVPLTLEQLSQILWAAQGITETTWGLRAAPSAGGTYPLEVYVVVRDGGVEGLPAGVYKYEPHKHSLKLIKEGDFSEELYSVSLEQPWVREAAINIVITAVYERTTGRYGERGIRYVHMEVGHVGQNIYLEVTNLGLGCVVIGAFHDDQVREVISADSNEHPLYVIPIGVPKQEYRVTEEQIAAYILNKRED